MKKSLFVFGLTFLSSLLLVNCSKETEVADNTQIDTPSVNAGIPFELFAKPVETKTVNDGLNTNWKADDAINVFHAAAGSTSYTSDGSFSIASADVASGRFTGTISSKPASGTYDWYMFYPYDAALTTPANTSAKAFYIGGRTDIAQQQTGNSSKEHLAGTNYPLYGKVADVSFDEVPTLSMNHVCAYIEFNVTNNSGMPLTVEDITFTATEDIVGQFYIDFSNPASIAFAEGTYTTDVASLEVTSGTSIADKASATFYVGIKPFTAPKDGTLTISVNGYEKSITLSTKAVEFTAGKIKKLNFDYDFKPATYALTTSVAAGDEVIIASGTTGTVNVMSHYDSSYNNHRSTTASVAGSNIISTPSMAVLTLAESESAYTLYDTETSLYLNATNTTTANYLKATSVIDAYAKFTISFSGSAAVITCSGKSSRNILRANGEIFACYTSGQSPVYLYKKAKTPVSITVTTPPTKTSYKCGETIDMTGAVITATYSDATTANVVASVTTDAESVLAHVGTGKTVTVSYFGLTDTFTIDVAKGDADLSYATTAYTVAPNASFATPSLTNPHGLDVTYSASNSKATVNASTGAVTIGADTGDVVITAHTDGNADYEEGDASYTITIKSIVTYTYVFNSKSWGAKLGDDDANWTSGKDGNALTSGRGVQITTGVSGANATSPRSFTNVSAITVTYSMNASKGVGTIKVKVGSGTEQSFSVTKPSGDGTDDKTKTFTFSPNETGSVKLTVNCTENSIYIKQIAITAE